MAMFGIGHWELLLILICAGVPVLVGVIVVMAILASQPRGGPPHSN